MLKKSAVMRNIYSSYTNIPTFPMVETLRKMCIRQPVLQFTETLV